MCQNERVDNKNVTLPMRAIEARYNAVQMFAEKTIAYAQESYDKSRAPAMKAPNIIIPTLKSSCLINSLPHKFIWFMHYKIYNTCQRHKVNIVVGPKHTLRAS